MASLGKLGAIAIEPRAWRALGLGVAATMEHAGALGRLDFATVIDVGANKGQFAAFAMRTWPLAQLVCFEPLPGPRTTLARVTDGRAKLFDCALGAEDGHADIHVASRDDSSSMLQMNALQKDLYGMTEAGPLRVPVRRLDVCLETLNWKTPALLKIDVQGFELQVLAGAAATLARIDAAYIELSFVELYKSQALADDVLAVTRACGLALTGVFNQTEGPDGAPIQADFLFTRQRARAE